MIIGTANIKNYPDMPKKLVIADAKEVAARCDIWGMQENNPAEDDEVISPALGDRWGKVGGGTNLPFFFRRDKIVCVGYRIFFMDWVDEELMLVPKPRLGAIGKFELRGRPGVPFWSAMNTHLIAGGLNGPREPRRAAQWHHEENKTSSMYRKEHAKRTGTAAVKEVGQGRLELNSDHDAIWVDVSLGKGNPTGLRTVFYLGDFNNPKPPKPAEDFDWFAGQRLDRIGVSRSRA